MKATLKGESPVSTDDLNVSVTNLAPFIANETKGGPSHYLRIPHGCLNKFGKDEILEARVVRMSAPESELISGQEQPASSRPSCKSGIVAAINAKGPCCHPIPPRDGTF